MSKGYTLLHVTSEWLVRKDASSPIISKRFDKETLRRHLAEVFNIKPEYVVIGFLNVQHKTRRDGRICEVVDYAFTLTSGQYNFKDLRNLRAAGALGIVTHRTNNGRLLNVRVYNNDGKYPGEVIRDAINSDRDIGRGDDKDDYLDRSVFPASPEAFQYAAYSDQQRLIEINAVDFGDILLHSYNILVNHKDIQENHSNFIQHILIDEFQDTNLLQYDLIKLLLNANQNLFCVGDDDQSIYAWRGAKIENIINFPNEFNCDVVRLTKNYRSNNAILEAASSIISNNKNRLGKNLESFNNKIPEQKINLKSFYSQEEESLWVADSISRKFTDQESFGILVRNDSANEKH